MKLTDKILKEAAINHHYVDRLFERMIDVDTVKVGIEFAVGKYQTVGTYKVSDNFKNVLKDNIAKLEAHNFPVEKSYGVKILEIVINKDKVNYHSFMGRKIADTKPLLIVDNESKSNGDIIYAIIRENQLVTIYYGKSYVPQTPEKLRVDEIIGINDLKANKIYK